MEHKTWKIPLFKLQCNPRIIWPHPDKFLYKHLFCNSEDSKQVAVLNYDGKVRKEEKKAATGVEHAAGAGASKAHNTRLCKLVITT